MFTELHQQHSSPAAIATERATANAPDLIGRIIDRPPQMTGAVMRGDTRLTRRWAHGPVHDYLPGMSGHVLMTYYSAAKDIAWRNGAARITSRTRPGSITQIPEGRDGRWDIGGPIEVSHVYLTDARLQACADVLAGGRRIELIDRVAFEDAAAARILEMLSHEGVNDNPASRMFVEQAIDLLCIQLVRGHSSIGALSPAAPRRGLADWQIKRVTDYMRDHLDEEVSLATVAELVGLSRFHFCTAFRLATGETPHTWLTSLRMGRARELLAQHSLPITEIALAVGYQTPSAFTASFRRFSQVTPSEFRRAL